MFARSCERNITLRTKPQVRKPTIDNKAEYCDLDVSTACDLGEVFLRFEGLVDLVISDAEHAQSGLGVVVALREHDELGHERHQYRLAVQIRSHPGRLADALAIHQPKPTRTQLT